MLAHTIILATLATGAFSWSYSSTEVSGGLEYLKTSNEQQYEIFQQANTNANSTTEVPVNLGGTNFSLSVKVSEFGLPGVDTQIANPRAVLTTYDLNWNASFNSTFDNPGPACFWTVKGDFPKSVINQVTSDGNCSAALGEDCMAALQNTSPDCSSPARVPDACQSAFKSTTAGPLAFDIADSNGTRPDMVYASNSEILSPSDSESQYDEESTEMHFLLFRNGQRPNVPACVVASSAGAYLKAFSGISSIVWACVVLAWVM